MLKSLPFSTVLMHVWLPGPLSEIFSSVLYRYPRNFSWRHHKNAKEIQFILFHSSGTAWTRKNTKTSFSKWHSHPVLSLLLTLFKMKRLTSNLFIQSSLELICLERKKKRQINKTRIFQDKEFSMQHYFKQSRLHMTEILVSYDWHFLSMSEMHSVRPYAQ